jgi:glycosyltransferase involved in cell wall biosynthesis
MSETRPETLDNGKYGELVRVNDSEALAEKILNVLSGKSKPVDSAWLSQFTLENVCSKYLALLNLTEDLKTKN